MCGWHAVHLMCHHKQGQYYLCCKQPTSKPVAESKYISRVIREVNKHHIHLMAIGEQGNNHSWLPAETGQAARGLPHRLLHFLEHLQTSACYLQSRAHATHTQRFKTWPMEKVERWRLPAMSPGGGGQRVGGVYQGGSRPFAFTAFKEKGNLLLAGTVCVEVFPSRGLVEISCAIPSTDAGLE